MEVEEYAARQQALSAALVAIVLRVLGAFRLPLVVADWDLVVDLLFPYVDSYRTESARLGREFFDSQRDLHTGLPRHDTYLATYRREWLAEALFPARDALMRPGASDSAVSMLALRAVKEVENGGRRTILRGVESDPVVKGWARVATGRETCAFCSMLISRGAVYTSADNAGLDLDDTSAQELFARGDAEAMAALMTRWHPGCDCLVVPVYDRATWPGRDAHLRAKQIWADTTKGYGGQDAVNAFRRAIERGDIDPRRFAAAA
ncbi:MAG: hypothetical protein ABIQ18_15160 [Umezawaea sp.]